MISYKKKKDFGYSGKCYSVAAYAIAKKEDSVIALLDNILALKTLC